MDDSKILGRLKKLLALSRDASNPNEAAIAATRAAELMAEYNLSEAMLQTENPKDPIVTDFVVGDDATTMKKKVAWKGAVAYAVAKSFGCKQWWYGGSIRFYGRSGAVQAASYTTQYLWNEIDNLAREALKNYQPVYTHHASRRAFGSSFRLGAANAVAVRVAQAAQARKAEQAVKIEQMAKAPESAPMAQQVSQALVRIDADQAEVDEGYENYSRRFTRRSTNIGRISASNAYNAGRAAAQRINLGGAARSNRLGAPAPRLKA